MGKFLPKHKLLQIGVRVYILYSPTSLQTVALPINNEEDRVSQLVESLHLVAGFSMHLF